MSITHKASYSVVAIIAMFPLGAMALDQMPRTNTPEQRTRAAILATFSLAVLSCMALTRNWRLAWPRR